MKQLTFLVCLCFSILIHTTSVYTQVAGYPSGENDKILSTTTIQQKSAQESQLKSEQTPTDNVIDPTAYKLGPGDVLGYIKFDAMSVEELLVISPENTLIIPRIGWITVTGKTLSQVRDTVLYLQKQRTPSISSYLFLKKSRSVYVTIKGNVLFPGMRVFNAGTRVSTAIKAAMQPSSTSNDIYLQQQSSRAFGAVNGDRKFTSPNSSILQAYAMRNVVIHHSDGTTSLADLEKAFVSKDPTFDPYLREGDEVSVPQEVGTIPTMSINGAVLRPATLQSKKGDKLSFLLKAGGALTDNANISDVTLVQNGISTKIECDKMLNLLSNDMEVAPGAVVLVGENIKVLARNGSVRVYGEVKNPGVYPIESLSTKVTTVIEQSGGFTEQAYLPLAYILRRETAEQTAPIDDYRARVLKFYGTNLVVEDTARFFLDQAARRPMVSCDLEALFNHNKSNENVPLQDGDVIIVPQNPQTIFVHGQVNKPGYLPFVSGTTMSQYIERAGGYTENADIERRRIVKGRTGIWMDEKTTTITSGDMIYVPRPPDEPSNMQVQRYAAYATIGSVLFGVVTFLVNLYLNSRKTN